MNRGSGLTLRDLRTTLQNAAKHKSIFMRTTLDLPDDLLKRAKIAAVKRGSTLRDLVAEGLRRVLTDEPAPQRKRMTKAPVKLPAGHLIPVLSNREMAALFAREEVKKLNDVYRRR